MDHVGRDAPQDSSSSETARSRKLNRDSLFLVAKFRETAKRRPVSQVRIRNLSAGGLMADIVAPIAQGTAVEFDVRGIGWISGRVAWCVQGRIGVSFDHPVDPVLARKPVSSATKAAAVAKPTI
ncbi:MAG: PilZ domain-containing protein [Sphingomonas sp.]|nr:PilZ domain-containing protein [Sphingomonas sp.]